MDQMNRPSHKELLKVINSVKDRVKNSDVYKDLCKEYGVDDNYIYLVPMAFDDIDVSARTDKGCIYFNYALLDDGDFENEDHYMIHELVHHFQQCFGNGPTHGSTKDSYLDNKYEQEGFQAQTEYLSETRNDEAAENYVEKVLDHHDVPEKERDKRRKDLLELSANLWIEKRLKKKEAGLFRIPKAWLDRAEKDVFAFYAAWTWSRALEFVKRVGGLGKIVEEYEKAEYEGEGPLADFYVDLSKSTSEWAKILSELKPGDDYNYVIIESPEFIKPSIIESFYLSLWRPDENSYEVNVDSDEEIVKLMMDELSDVGFRVEKGPFPDSLRFVGDANKTSQFLRELSEIVLFDTWVPRLKKKMRVLEDLPSSEMKTISHLIQECKKYTSSPNGGPDEVTFTIPLAQLVMDLEAVSEYLDNIDLKRYGKIMINGLRRYGWPSEIPVHVFVGKLVPYTHGDKKQQARGLYSYNTHAVSVSLDDIFGKPTLNYSSVFVSSINNAKLTLRHEFQHMLQHMLQDIKNLSETAGLPSKKLRNPEYGPHGEPISNKRETEKIPHGLIDVEFYTDLTDAVNVFKNTTRNWTEDLKREYAKLFVGEPNNFADVVFNKVMDPDSIKEMETRPWGQADISRTKEHLVWQYKPNIFFNTLRMDAPNKWRVAVREFMKAI